LRDVFRDTGIQIIVYPAQNDTYTAQRWWVEPSGVKITIDEYFKMIMFLIGYHRLWY
jgi:hypothetical protein